MDNEISVEAQYLHGAKQRAPDVGTMLQAKHQSNSVFLLLYNSLAY
jgi:hypothetical protein